MKKKIVIWGAPVLILIFAALGFLVFKRLPIGAPAPEAKKGIIIDSPKPNSEISSPIKISGRVNGDGWIGFEGQVGVAKLFDGNGKQLGLALLAAKGEWMRADIEFETEMSFIPEKEGPGKLVFYNENPSGDPGREKTFEVPVVIKINPDAARVKVYFSNNRMDPDLPAGRQEFSCNQTFPAEREVAKAATLARTAVEELLKGPAEQEKTAGFYTSINPGVKIRRLVIENGAAKIDFDGQLEFQVGGSCRVAAIRSQITNTLKQFPTVKSVVISINGRTEDILQP